jgi:protein-tyrosine-phosphatase
MTPTHRVLFVCEHGAAKSVIAAHLLNHLGRLRGVAIDSSSAGLDPDQMVPPHVVAALQAEGVTVSAVQPKEVDLEMVQQADTVITFGCDLPALGSHHAGVIRWEGVPAVSDGYQAARVEIGLRVAKLLDDIEAGRRSSPP